MNKKTLLLALALALVLPMSAASADPVQDGKMCHHGHHGGHLAKALGLNADQQTKLDEIFKEEHEKFKALHEESHNRIKEVLTPEQLAKWEHFVSEHKGRHGHEHGHHHSHEGEAAPAATPASAGN